MDKLDVYHWILLIQAVLFFAALGYLTIGFGLGIVNRRKIIAEAKDEKRDD